MKVAIAAILRSLRGLLVDTELRTLLLQPIFACAKVYFATLCASIVVTILWFWFGNFTFEWMLLLEVFTAFASVVLLPILVAFLYFTFFCDEQFYAICKHVSGDTELLTRATEGSIQRKKHRGWAILILLLLPVLLVAMLFMPLLSFVFGAVLLATDVISYPLEIRAYSFSEKVGYFISHLIGLGIIGTVLSWGLVIPFAVLLLYPVGVLISAHYVAHAHS